MLKAIRAARAAARERAWALAGDAAPGADGGLVTVDLDAAIVIEFDKDQARPTWKRTFGFHPMTAWADHGENGNGEPLAIMLRPGTRAATRPPATMRLPGSRSRSCPVTCAAGSWCAPTPPSGRTSSWNG